MLKEKNKKKNIKYNPIGTSQARPSPKIYLYFIGFVFLSLILMAIFYLRGYKSNEKPSEVPET